VNKALYLIGPPGAGKSTLMRALVDGYDAEPIRADGVPAIEYRDENGGLVGAQLGANRETFSGTDALGMAIMPRAIDLVRTAPWPFLLGEGDRLASVKFLMALVDAEYAVTLALVDGADDLLAERRAARGSSQDEAWVRGRATKARNLADEWDRLGVAAHRRTYRMSAETPTAEAAHRLASMLGWPLANQRASA
jgi:energy-coupling factor transporter ATP-binding protein EcfA2